MKRRCWRSQLVGSVLVGCAASTAPAQTGLEPTREALVAVRGFYSSAQPRDLVVFYIDVRLGPGPGFGFAGVTVDFVQDASNPAPIDIAPLLRFDQQYFVLTSEPLPNVWPWFDRPGGIANPATPGSGLPSAYGGTPVIDALGRRALLQVGGAQNTTGQSGESIGQLTDAQPVVGLGIPFVVAVGYFHAPLTNGLYRFRLENSIVTYLETVGATGQASQVKSAFAYTQDFYLLVSGCLVDFDGDGSVTQDDLAGYLTAFLADPPYEGHSDFGFGSGPCPSAASPYDYFGYQADFDQDCSLTQDDLSAFLSAYFAEVENPSAECSPP